MRCNNCGWQNEAGLLKCEKCNYPLDGSLNAGQGRPKDPFRSNDPSVKQSDSDDLGKTIKGHSVSGPFLDEANRLQEDHATGRITPEPGKGPDPWEGNLTDPQSRNRRDIDGGKTEGGKNTPPPPPARPSQVFEAPTGQVQGTMDPFRQAPTQKKSFTLSFISREGEAEGAPMAYAGESIELNRDNVEPGNNSITSKVQAVVEFIDGAWYIVDKSAHQTTFVQAKQPVKLESGDVILLGNRKIVFKEEEE